jgi:tetratricopeptide (TPR) repeat protein
VAKQRRVPTRPPAKSRRGHPVARAAKPSRPSTPLVHEPPAKSGAYFEAVSLYERGLAALGRHDFAGAAARLTEVLTRFPDERELHERVRLYLKVCERELQPKTAAPRSLEEQVYAATIALNAGNDAEALRLLKAAGRDETGQVAYMLAVVHARRGARAEALAELRRAAEQDPENRALARRDADFEPLREDEEFLQVTAPVSAGGRRRSRPRASR